MVSAKMQTNHVLVLSLLRAEPDVLICHFVRETGGKDVGEDW
jgi:hypothetical protein